MTSPRSFHVGVFAVCLVLIALVTPVSARPLRAQSDTTHTEPLRLIGILDAKTGDWINRAVVRDTLGEETLTTRYGVATLNVLAPIAGFYLIEIRKEGYVPRRVRIRADTSYQAMFALEPNPLGTATQLPAIVTTDRQRLQDDSGERAGFFERCQMKTVQCVGRVDLDKRPTAFLDNLVGMKEGVHRACVPTNHGPVITPDPKQSFDDQLLGCLITMRSAVPPPEYCTPTFFVDGFEWQPLAGRSQAQIDHFLPPKSIAGIEIYLATQPHPPRFSPPPFSGCGVIVIWTR